MKKTILVFLSPWLLATGQAVAQPTAGSFNSGLRISEAGTGPGDFVVEWFGADGFYYFPEQSSDLVNWSWLVGNYGVGDDSVLGFNVSTTDDRLFVRLQSDDDPNSELLSMYWIDEDNNGIHDAWEMFWFGATGIDPLAISGSGFSNVEAFLFGLNPHEDAHEDASVYVAYTYNYDQLTGASGPALALEYGYDPAGNIESVSTQ